MTTTTKEIKDWTENYSDDLVEKSSFLNKGQTFYTSTQLDSTQHGIVADKLILGEIKSPDYVEGERGFRIDSEGIAEFGAVSYNKLMINPGFESMDGWQILNTAISVMFPGYLQIATTVASPYSNYAYIPTDDLANLSADCNYNPTIEYLGCIGGSVALTAFAGMGGEPVPSDAGVFFKYTLTTVNAVYIDSSNVEHSTVISGYNPKTLALYKIKVLKSDVAGYFYIKYYIDGKLVYTYYVNDLNMSGYPINFIISNEANGTVSFYCYKVLFFQDYK